MPRKQTGKKTRSQRDQAPRQPDPTPVPEGMPRPDSVIGEKAFTSPKGRKYTILKTTERDATDKPPSPPSKNDQEQ